MDTEFILKSDCCLHASFYSDHAILKVPYTKTKLESCKLSPYPNSYSICDSMNVHVFGFPGSSKDFDHDYAVISCTISGFDRGCLLITGLSAPGLSGSAIVCTVRGWPIGYLGGELTSGESESHQYLTYGYLLSGILRVLTELLPRFQRRKLNKWIDHFFQNAFQTEWNRIIRKQYSLFDLHFILYVQKMDEMIKLRSQLTKINAS